MARRRRKKKTEAPTDSLPVGTRVGMIGSSDDATVYLVGYGVYMGLDEPPVDIGVPFEMIEFFGPHKIVLDDEQVVWGFQGWWGPEEKVKEWIGAREVVPIP